MDYRCDLSVAGIRLQIESDQLLEIGVPFLPFLAEYGPGDFRAVFRGVESLPPIPEKPLHTGNVTRLYERGDGSRIRFFFREPGADRPYAVSFEDTPGVLDIQYLPEEGERMGSLKNCFWHLGLESLLIRHDRLFFHAACVDTKLGGLLFSGPSGIGKSTQAELWCRFRHAKQINGDRPILEKQETGWLAWGAPYAGSSQCYFNEFCQVSAIVMLRQEKTCTLRRLTPSEAFRAAWSGATVQSWNRPFVERASDLVLELIKSVPVFEFGCTADERAVEFLERELGKEL